MAWLYKRNYDRAIADLDQAIGLDPKSSFTYSNRGFAWWHKGDDDRAIADFDKAILLDPKDAEAFYNRALAWANKGADGRAIADFSQAILLDSTAAQSFQDRGILRFYSGPIADAQADLEQAARLEPNNAYFAVWADLAQRRNGLAGSLRDAESRLDMTRWPAPVVRMLLGDLTPEATLAAADDPDAAKKAGQVCEANFFTAELDRLQKRDGEALRLYRVSVRDCPRTFVEYHAAGAALRALSP